MTSDPRYEVVIATQDEFIGYVEGHHGDTPSVDRVRCTRCHLRMWKSGMAVASHERSCAQIPVHDWVGYREHRWVITNSGKRLYVLMNAREQGLDTSGGDWVLSCVTHSTLCNFTKRWDAHWHMLAPEFCEYCMLRADWCYICNDAALDAFDDDGHVIGWQCGHTIVASES